MFLQGQISLPLLIYNVYMVKSVSLYRFTICSVRGEISLPLLIYNVFTGEISLPLSFYNIFTGSNQPLFIDLQYFYRVKSVSLYQFKIFLQGQKRLHLFDLQGFYSRLQATFLFFQI